MMLMANALQAEEVVDTGIECLGAIPWGTHFCQFYEDRADLHDMLIPYFKTGLENSEACLWVTDQPFSATDATDCLRAAVPDLDARIRDGQMTIIDAGEWYKGSGSFGPDAVIENWLAFKDKALNSGFTGLRLTGNTFWLEHPGEFADFAAYEARVNAAFRDHRIVCLCSYCLSKTQAVDVLDVVRNHEFAVIRRDGTWDVVENASLKVAKEQLRQANTTLERRVAERTAELKETADGLRRALDDKETLLREVHHRVKNNLQVISSLLVLKGRNCTDERVRDAFNEMLQRIAAMSLVHEALYQRDDSSRIDLVAYLEGLGTSQIASHGADDRIRCTVAGRDEMLNLNTAVPVGLIAAEVISNSLKHGFSGGREGVLRITVDSSRGSRVLTIEDDGCGLPADDGRGSGTGMRLVAALVGQIDGRFTLAPRPGGGTAFRLAFPAA